LSPSSAIGNRAVESSVIPGPLADELVAPAPLPEVLSPDPSTPISAEARPPSTNPLTTPLTDRSTAGSSTVLRGSAVADLPVVDFISPTTLVDRRTGLASTAAGNTDDHIEGQTPAPGPTQADLDAAYDSGWAEGQAAARTAVDAAGRATEALSLAIAEMRSFIENERAASDELVVELAIEISRLILAREVSTASNPGRDAIVRSLAEAATSAPATFRLNPDDLAALGEIDELATGRSIELVADPTIGSGDAMVEVAGGRIDGTIAGALQRVAEVLGS